MDYPDPEQIAEIKKRAEEEARNPRKMDAGQRVAAWMLGALLASPLMLFAIANAPTEKLDATVTETEFPFFFLNYCRLINTDQGILRLQHDFNGQIEKGRRYEFTVGNESSTKVDCGPAVRGEVRSLRPMP
jgi:hypothetical protein